MRRCYFLILASILLVSHDSFGQQLDTLEHRIVAPGVFHTKYFQPGPYVLDVLEIDLTNPHITVESIRHNGLERTTTTTARNDREGHRVIGAINGDFFSFETGWPINNQVENGEVVLGKPAVRSHFALDIDKRPYIEQFSFQGSVTRADESSHAINAVNTTRGSGQMVFYTSYYGGSTGTTGGVEATVELVEGAWVAGDTLRVVVRQTRAGGSAIPSNGGVISAASGGPGTFLNDVAVDDTLKLYLGFAPDVNRITQLMAGGGRILENGENVSHLNPQREQVSTSFMNARHPRTFVGISEDSTRVYFCTVDGRQATSLGMNFNEMASFLQRIGVYHAFNLDGGGSTTMVVRNEVVNSPSDPGGERSVANSLHVVSTAPLGTLSRLDIAPRRAELFQESQLQFSATGTDEFYNPIPLPEDVVWEADANIGTIDQNGLFTAAAANDSGWVRVRWHEVADSARVIVRVLEEMRVYPRVLEMVPGERVTLHVRGRDTSGELVNLQNTQVQLQASGPEINVNPQGVVTGMGFGDGILTVTLDTISVEVPYELHGNPILRDAEVFDGFFDWMVDVTAPEAYGDEPVTAGLTPDEVLAGENAVEVNYDVPGGEAVLHLRTNQQLSSRIDTFYVNVYGDGGNHQVELYVTDRDGELFRLTSPTSVTWSDEWRRVGFIVGDAAAVQGGNLDFPLALRELRVRIGTGNMNGGRAEGTFYIDRIEARYPARGVAPAVLFNFETGITGWFTPAQTHPAQIHGVDVDASSLVRSNERAYKGQWSGRWTYVDDVQSSADWDIRITRGAGQDLGNILRGAYVGAWVYVEGQTDLTLRIIIRGGDGQLKQGPPLELNHVGWKLIGARLEEHQFQGYIHGMTPFTPSGNQFNGFRLTGPNEALQGETRVFYLDELVTSALTVPTGFHTFDVSFSAPNVRVMWEVNSEVSVDRYAVERSTGGAFQEIGIVNAVGNADTTQSYEYVDVVSDPVNEIYTYRVRQITNDGAQELSPEAEVQVVIVSAGDEGIIETFQLHQNYPNPFNPATTIRYSVPYTSEVTLKVWNVLGQEVATLVDQSHAPGAHTITFDASRLASGVYFYRMEARQPGEGTPVFAETRKLILMK